MAETFLFAKHYQAPLWSSQGKQMTRAACSTPARHEFRELYTQSSLSPSFLKLVLLCWHWAHTWCFCKAIIDPFLPRLHCSKAAAAPEPFSAYLQAASCWCLPWELLNACLWCESHPAVSAHSHHLHPPGQWVPPVLLQMSLCQHHSISPQQKSCTSTALPPLHHLSHPCKDLTPRLPGFHKRPEISMRH